MEAIHPNVAAANEDARLMEEYMLPPVMESQSRIMYSAFGQANFNLRTNGIKIFQNALFGSATENPNAHILRFLDICATIEHPGVK